MQTEKTEEGAQAPQRRVPLAQGVLALTGAVVLLTLNGTLMNATLFPLFDSVFSYARDISIMMGVVLDALLVLAVMVRPRLFARPAVWTAGGLLVWVLGVPLMLWSLRAGSAAGLIVGSSLVNMVGALFSVLGMVACCAAFDAAGLLVAVPIATIAATLLSSAVTTFAPQGFALAIYAVALPLGVLPTVRLYSDVLRRTAHAPSARDLSVTSPASYLPLGSRMFACLLVFSLVNGFLLRFSPAEGTANSTVITAFALVLLGVYCMFSKSVRRMDSIMLVAVLFIMAGFLLVPVESAALLATDAIAVGNAFYNLVATLMICTLASRNELAAVSVVAWSKVWSTTGTTIGANVGAVVGGGLLGNDTLVATALMALALLAFVMLGLRDFSFDVTIAGIEPVELPEHAAGEVVPDIDATCAGLAASCGLTAREAEVLCLLAHGRNNSYIQEELTLTRNTVKSYIKHIYAKLGVHSQQELIDRATGAGR